MLKNIDKFVMFYDKIIENHKTLTFPTAFSNVYHDMMENVGVPLVFLFNGADNETVFGLMQARIKYLLHTTDGTKIRGHPVVVIYCNSIALEMWEARLRAAAEKLQFVITVVSKMRSKGRSDADIMDDLEVTQEFLDNLKVS